MTFAEYLEKRGLTDQAAASEIGEIDRSTVAHLRLRSRKPSINVAARIERWSQGLVPASSFADIAA